MSSSASAVDQRNQVCPSEWFPLIESRPVEMGRVQELFATTVINPNKQDWLGRTALTIAAKIDDLELAEFLIKMKADVDLPNMKKGTPLMIAASHGHINMIKLLLKAGAKVNQQTDGQTTGLMRAVLDGRATRIARRYFYQGTRDIDFLGSQSTALMHAVVSGYANVARLLLEAGALACLKNYNRETALMLAGELRESVQDAEVVTQVVVAEDGSIKLDLHITSNRAVMIADLFEAISDEAETPGFLSCLEEAMHQNKERQKSSP